MNLYLVNLFSKHIKGLRIKAKMLNNRGKRTCHTVEMCTGVSVYSKDTISFIKEQKLRLCFNIKKQTFWMFFLIGVESLD